MGVLQSRQQHQPQYAVAVAGQLEPIEPAYYKDLSPSPIASHLATPSEPVGWKTPVVHRGQNVRGMRYLLSRGAVRQPLSILGQGPDIGISVWKSAFQPYLSSTHDCGFYDRLFSSGYPGFNLGLSFKVQTLQENATGGPGANLKMKTPNIKVVLQNLQSGKGIVQEIG
jgi:hypothetical protein